MLGLEVNAEGGDEVKDGDVRLDSRMYCTTSIDEGSWCPRASISASLSPSTERERQRDERTRAHLLGERNGDERPEEAELAPGLEAEEAEEGLKVLESVLDGGTRQAPAPLRREGVACFGGFGRARLDRVGLVCESGQSVSKGRKMESAACEGARTEDNAKPLAWRRIRGESRMKGQ